MISTFTLWILAGLSILLFFSALIWSIYTVKRTENILNDRNNNSNQDVEKGLLIPTTAPNLPTKSPIKGISQSKMDQLLFLRSLYSIDSDGDSSSSSDEDISEWTSLLSDFHANKSTFVTQMP